MDKIVWNRTSTAVMWLRVIMNQTWGSRAWDMKYICLCCDVFLTYRWCCSSLLALPSQHTLQPCLPLLIFQSEVVSNQHFLECFDFVPSIRWFYLLGSICQTNIVWYLSSKVLNIQVKIARIAEGTQEDARCGCRSSHRRRMISFNPSAQLTGGVEESERRRWQCCLSFPTSRLRKHLK